MGTTRLARASLLVEFMSPVTSILSLDPGRSICFGTNINGEPCILPRVGLA